MQYSFYGGQQGKNFEIATIFHNKVEMMQDLMQRYSSNISIGDFVFISYGSQNEQGPSYTNNADIDVKAFGATYNATLWQKIYTEEGDESSELTEYISKDFGLGYKLIASLTGNTPVFKVEYKVIKADQKPSITIDVNSPNSIDFPLLTFNLPVTQILSLLDTIVLDADKKPNVVYDDTNVDEPSIQFSLPQAQEIKPENVSTTVLDVGEDPEVVVDTTGNNADGTKKVNKPTVEFKLPQGQQILPDNVSTTTLDADEEPNVVFDNDPTHTNADGSKKVNKPSLEFQLPQSQVIGLGTVTVVDADKNPAVALDETNVNRPKLNISLPRSQVLQLNPTIVLAPSKDPDAKYDDMTINTPELTLSLPRAVRFMYGDRLGKRSAGTYTLTTAAAPEIADLNEGDYYVNEETGFIYLVTGETAADRTFEFQACLAAPEPSVSSTTVDTYENDGTDFVVKEPSITKSWSNPTDQIGRVLGFNLPKLPNLKGAIEFCGPDETGSITGKPTSTTEFTYSFTIPTGARFFCGNEVDDNNLSTTVTDAKPGDFYINGLFEGAYDGNVYKLGTNNVWVKDGNIKGNVGNPLNITSSFTITPAQVATDDKDLIAAYIEAQLGNKKPDGHEIIAVTYRAPADGGGTIDTAYWYFVTNNIWNRVQLTGATASLIENAYKSAGDSNKAYSVTYINNLLAAFGTLTIPADKKVKTYTAEAIEEMLTWGSFADL